MYPEILKVGPVTIYSYGLMLGMAFIVASYLFTVELKRVNLNPNIATEVTLISLVAGIVGAKLFHVLENWSEFIDNPVMALSPAGLTWYGGFLLALLFIFLYIKKKKIPFLTIADLNSPGLALGYGIARIGCHLSGDGDYGIVSNLPWAYSYLHGTVPTPPGVLVHPTPIYELIAGIIMFVFLWSIRKKMKKVGELFMIYLILTSISRFLVETIRINPRIIFNLSEAQLISVILCIIGIAGIYFLKKKPVKNTV
jgi:phosphatidylglycerol---prolipoprotein diacylglyceryl transferase